MTQEPWLRWLNGLLKACEWLALPALLGFAKRGCPLWLDARILLLPAGTATIGRAILLGSGVLPWPVDASPRRRRVALATLTSGGLALIAVGIHHFAPGRGVMLLGLPLGLWSVAGGGFLLARGRRAVSADLREQGGWRRAPRILGAGGICFGIVVTLYVVGVIDLGRDDCT